MFTHPGRLAARTFLCFCLFARANIVLADEGIEQVFVLDNGTVSTKIPLQKALKSKILTTFVKLHAEWGEFPVNLNSFSDEQVLQVSEYLQTGRIPQLTKGEKKELVKIADYLDIPILLNRLAFEIVILEPEVQQIQTRLGSKGCALNIMYRPSYLD